MYTFFLIMERFQVFKIDRRGNHLLEFLELLELMSQKRLEQKKNIVAFKNHIVNVFVSF